MKKVILTMVVAVLATSGMAQSDCGELLDHNQDGVIGVEDLMNLLSFFGQSLEVDAGPCDNLQSVTFDGYDYDLVAIGDQCWFAENLRTEHYANGDTIPANFTDDEWSSTTSGAVAVYGEDAGCIHLTPDGDACDPSWSLNEYGRLYNWYAVDDSRGLCPTGWHVPSDGEWAVLTNFLGGEDVAGAEMKTTFGWYSGGNGTNSSGFSGLPGGTRDHLGNFSAAGNFGIWWSSSLSGSSSAVGRWLHFDTPSLQHASVYSSTAYSVRCVRDTE